MNYQKAIKGIRVISNSNKNQKNKISTTYKGSAARTQLQTIRHESQDNNTFRPQLHDKLTKYYHGLQSKVNSFNTLYTEKQQIKPAQVSQDIPEQILQFMQEVIAENVDYNNIGKHFNVDKDKDHWHQQILKSLIELYPHSTVSIEILDKMITEFATAIQTEMKQAAKAVPALQQAGETLILLLHTGKKHLKQAKSSADNNITAIFNIDKHCEALQQTLSTDEHVHTQYKSYKKLLNNICAIDQTFNKIIEENGGQNVNWIINVLAGIYKILVAGSSSEPVEINKANVKARQISASKTITSKFFQEESSADQAPTLH